MINIITKNHIFSVIIIMIIFSNIWNEYYIQEEDGLLRPSHATPNRILFDKILLTILNIIRFMYNLIKYLFF
jgi:hypothetical protein